MRLRSLSLTISNLLFVSIISYGVSGLGPDPYAISDNELIKACQLGEIDKVRSLIKAGADINVKDKNGIFPLLGAAFAGKTEVAKALIEAKALLNQFDRFGFTPLMIASTCCESIRQREDVALLLIEAGAEINHKTTYKNQNVLMLAVQCGSDYFIKALLDAGVNINEKDSDGQTALMLASGSGKIEAVKALIRWGADVKATNNNGSTALMYATFNRTQRIDTVKTFIESGADVNAVDNNGSTALMFAASHRPEMHSPESTANVEIIKLLLQNGANRSIQNKQNQTAWNFAVDAGNFDVLEMLDE